MNDTGALREEFMRELAAIQEQAVQSGIARYQSADNLEGSLYDVTFAAMLDGCGRRNPQLDLVDRASGCLVAEGVQLHDLSVEYLHTEL